MLLFFKKERGNALIDWYSIMHISAGLVVGAVLKLLNYDYGLYKNFKEYLIIGIMLLACWELFEMLLRYIKNNFKKIYKLLLKFLPGYIFLREGTINVLSDIAIGVFGLLIINWLFN